jgi:hypothetical protein
MAIKYTNKRLLLHATKNYPNLDFLFEDMPSGNPGAAKFIVD